MRGSANEDVNRRRLAFHSKLGFLVVRSGKRSPAWEAEPRHASGSSPGVLILVACGALATGLAVALFSHRDSTSTTEMDSAMVSPVSARLGPLDILTDASRVIRHYLAATSVDDKVYYARRPRAVRPLMERYYQSHPFTPVKPDAIKMIGRLDDVQREHPLYLAVALLGEDEVIPMALEEREGRYRIDWETQVGYSPSTVEDFLTMHVGEPMWFRLYATTSDYYNYTFSDSKTHLSLKLEFPGQSESYYGYIHRDHPDYGKICEVLRRGKRVPMILSLRRSEGSGTNQLDIASFEQGRWFVDQDPGTYAQAWSSPGHLITAR